jgi:hypothetical protein
MFRLVVDERSVRWQANERQTFRGDFMSVFLEMKNNKNINLEVEILLISMRLQEIGKFNCKISENIPSFCNLVDISKHVIEELGWADKNRARKNKIKQRFI